jgi:DeoR/GlpR family transcriptional regulator of sugar metabolism
VLADYLCTSSGCGRESEALPAPNMHIATLTHREMFEKKSSLHSVKHQKKRRAASHVLAYVRSHPRMPAECASTTFAEARQSQALSEETRIFYSALTV